MTEPAAQGSAVKSSGGWWSYPALTIGIAIIACALIVAQVEENRLMSWQKNKLQQDVEHLREQVRVNQEFLDRLNVDEALVERLAQRQMKLVREGSAALELEGETNEIRSPFTLVRVPPPPEVEPYQPDSGPLTQIFGTAHRRVWAFGAGALLIAASLILGVSVKR